MATTTGSYHELHRTAFHNPDGAHFLHPLAWLVSFVPFTFALSILHLRIGSTALFAPASTSTKGGTTSSKSHDGTGTAAKTKKPAATPSASDKTKFFLLELFTGMLPFALISALPQFTGVVLRLELTVFVAWAVADPNCAGGSRLILFGWKPLPHQKVETIHGMRSQHTALHCEGAHDSLGGGIFYISRFCDDCR